MGVIWFLQEGKSAVPLRKPEDVGKAGVGQPDRKVSASLPGSSKSKSETKQEKSLKRRRPSDGDGRVQESGSAGKQAIISANSKSTGGDISGSGAKAKDADEHLPFPKRARVREEKVLSSEDRSAEGKQKHVTAGHSGLGGADVEKDSPRDVKSRERGTSLPPKADKDRIRKAALDGEAALPPSKRRHRAFEAMSACEAEAATAGASQPGEELDSVAASNDAGVGNPVAGGPSEPPRKDCKSPVPASENVCSTSRTATFTLDLLDAAARGRQRHLESGLADAGVRERGESGNHPAKDVQAVAYSPSKVGGSGDQSKLLTKSEGRGKLSKLKSSSLSKDSVANPSYSPSVHGKSDVEGGNPKDLVSPLVPAKLGSESVKRKGHLTLSDSGKLSTPTSGGPEGFTSSVPRPSLDDSTIKNA